MNSGPTSERVYDEIKRNLLGGLFRPGERLDPAALALQAASSITPVRDALNRLTGEGLVDTGTSDGFHAPHVDEPSLEDLYAWNLEILSLGIKGWSSPSVHTELSSDSPTTGFEELALIIGERSANAEHVRAIRSLNDRLRAARAAEVVVMRPEPDELDALAKAISARDKATLRRLLAAYHRRRSRKAAMIVRAIYRF